MPLLPVDNRQVAAVVTHLEMRERPKPQPIPTSRFRLARWKAPEPEKYRALFERVGAPWLWFSRLAIAEAALLAIIHDPKVEIYAVTDPRGVELGLIELDFRAAGACELGFFGLVPPLTSKGIGKWMMANALAFAWRPGIERVWVHTCTLDHPAALGFYRKAGFIAYKREIEIFDDPRIRGFLPKDAAPHIPRLD